MPAFPEVLCFVCFDELKKDIIARFQMRQPIQVCSDHPGDPGIAADCPFIKHDDGQAVPGNLHSTGQDALGNNAFINCIAKLQRPAFQADACPVNGRRYIIDFPAFPVCEFFLESLRKIMIFRSGDNTQTMGRFHRGDFVVRNRAPRNAINVVDVDPVTSGQCPALITAKTALQIGGKASRQRAPEPYVRQNRDSTGNLLLSSEPSKCCRLPP